MKSMLLVLLLISSCAESTILESPKSTPLLPPKNPPADIGAIQNPESMVSPIANESNAQTPKLQKEHVVVIERYAFNPRELIIEQGDRVIWKNMGRTPHEIVGPGFLSNPLHQNEQYSQVFPTLGNYTINSARYPATQGKIIVDS